MIFKKDKISSFILDNLKELKIASINLLIIIITHFKHGMVILFIVLSNFTFGQTNVKEPIQGTLIGRVTLSVESNLKEIPDGGAKIYIMDSTKENQDIFDETNNEPGETPPLVCLTCP